jgi:hypothetical protein
MIIPDHSNGPIWDTVCGIIQKKKMGGNYVMHLPALVYTPLAVVSCARKTLRVSTTAMIAQIPAVLSKEGAVTQHAKIH